MDDKRKKRAIIDHSESEEAVPDERTVADGPDFWAKSP
jgi:hypothetical protein